MRCLHDVATLSLPTASVIVSCHRPILKINTHPLHQSISCTHNTAWLGSHFRSRNAIPGNPALQLAQVETVLGADSQHKSSFAVDYAAVERWNALQLAEY